MSQHPTSQPPRRHRLLALLAASLVVLPAAGRAAGKVADGRFSPGGTPASSYGGQGGRCAAGAVLDYLQPRLADLARERGRPVPEVDPRLCAAAESLLGWPSKKAQVPPEVTGFTADWVGVESAPQQAFVEVYEHTWDRANANDDKEVTERLFELAGSFMLNANHPRLGLATEKATRGGARSGKRETRFALVMLDSPLRIDAGPRRLDLGQSAPLTGSILGDVAGTTVLVGDPRGQVQKAENPQGRTFSTEVRCGQVPGKIYVEIRSKTAAGAPRLISNFTVACGQEPPASVAVEAAEESWPEGTDEQERKAFDQVNAERAASGLPALAWDPAVASVARAVSQRLKDGTAETADIGSMLVKAGASAALVLQNPGLAPTGLAASRRFVSAPTSRANILSSEVNTGGVGLVNATDAQGQKQVYMTQLFVKQLPPVDVEKVRQELRDAIAARRVEAKVAALKSDPVFEQEAERYAKELAEAKGELPPSRDEKLVASLSKGFVVKMLVGAASDPLDYAKEKKATATGQLLGVGVAQGQHKSLGKNAFYVVVLIAERTGAAPPAPTAPPPAKAPAAKPAPGKAKP